jgi:subtilisin family serine protease
VQDATHPDLNYVGGSTWAVPSLRKTWDVANPDVDYHGHGTHVAGIIGARNNGRGVVGAAAGIPLYSLKILDADGAGELQQQQQLLHQQQVQHNASLTETNAQAFWPALDTALQAASMRN